MPFSIRRRSAHIRRQRFHCACIHVLTDYLMAELSGLVAWPKSAQWFHHCVVLLVLGGGANTFQAIASPTFGMDCIECCQINSRQANAELSFNKRQSHGCVAP